MNNTEIGNNIINAFKVVEKTQYSTVKMLTELDEIINNKYISIAPKYLRYRSDVDVFGLTIKSFIKLYQSKSDPLHSKNPELRNGDVLGLEINFADYDSPKILISKFIYENLESKWSALPSISEHWGFYHPLHNKEQFSFEIRTEKIISSPKTEKIKNTYWGLDKVIFVELDLLDIDSSVKIESIIMPKLDELHNYTENGN